MFKDLSPSIRKMKIKKLEEIRKMKKILMYEIIFLLCYVSNDAVFSNCISTRYDDSASG